MISGPRIAIAVLLVAGCSTVAEQPAPVECELDTDCPEGFDCNNEVCVPGDQLPPLRHLGFDVREVTGQEVNYRSEVNGCDLEIDRAEDCEPGQICIERAYYSQTLRLEVFEQTPADFEMPTLDELLLAELRIDQVSRHGREGLFRTVDHPELSDTMELLPTTIAWPRYHPADALPPAYGSIGFLLWTVTPQAPEDMMPPLERAPMYQMLMPPRMGEPCTEDLDCCPEGQVCEDKDVEGLCDLHPLVNACRTPSSPEYRWRFIYQTECDRLVEGDVAAITGDLQVGNPLPSVSIRMRYADPTQGDRLGVHALDAPAIDDRPFQCDDDADCIAGEQFCNTETNQCVLALAGRNAGRSISTDDAGEFGTRVYTYCEPGSGMPLDRSFTITATPPAQAMQPPATFRVDARFNPPLEGQSPPTPLDRDICLPDWGSPIPVELQLTGSPVTLVSSDELTYTCCDLSCLPASEEDADTPPPSVPESCTGSAATGSPSLRAETDFIPSTEMSALWEDETSPCLEPVVNDDGIAGVFSRAASCSAAGLCTFTDADGNVSGLAAGDSGEPRMYRVRIETPQGSLLGSRDIQLAVDQSGPMSTDPIVLPIRRLVTGRVTLPPELCDPASEECGAKNAVVYAERLRMPNETTATTPGPYFHQVTAFHEPVTDRPGAYILPLDPGVWILTALPAPGGLGGPAKFALIDLREVSSATQDFELDPGILVTVNVGSFDRRSQVFPLDRGSWLAEGRTLAHPGRADDPDPSARLVDLNRDGECLTSDGTTGCKIRRLFPGTSLPLTQVGTVRFSTRSSPGGAVCL